MLITRLYYAFLFAWLHLSCNCCKLVKECPINLQSMALIWLLVNIVIQQSQNEFLMDSFDLKYSWPLNARCHTDIHLILFHKQLKNGHSKS